MKQQKKKIGIRILLGILIILNMGVIFLLSAQNGEESNKTSGKVTQTVVQITVQDFESKPKNEQEQIISTYHPLVRKLAHMTEFGTLGALILLFLLTWESKRLLRYGASLGVTFLYACSDEWHQSLTSARGSRFTDVLIDLGGAVLCCTVVLIGYQLIHRKNKKERNACRSMQVTRYYLQNTDPTLRLAIAVVSDLHGEAHDKLAQALQKESPDLILIPGDLMEDSQLEPGDASGYDLLRFCARLAPTFYSLGNHEIGCYHSEKPWVRPSPVPLSAQIKARIAETGAHLLDNEETRLGKFAICGLTSGLNGDQNRPDLALLERFSKRESFRILLCHHPEYYVPYIRPTDIELTVSGHAHGGQWRFFGRGVFAPGQGLFPKYTAGVIDNRCVISRGLGNHTRIPRFFNPPELVMVYYGYEAPKTKK